jgi:hypothetical protein
MHKPTTSARVRTALASQLTTLLIGEYATTAYVIAPDINIATTARMNFQFI